MDLDLGDKLALITGGSRGIGRAVGEALAAEGCRLVLVSRRAADLDVARTQIEGRYNVSVRTDAADLGDSTNVPRRRSSTNLFCTAKFYHSITSSARSRIDCGTVRPSALAVLRLMTNSIFVICCTGRSAGFSPLRMRPI